MILNVQNLINAVGTTQKLTVDGPDAGQCTAIAHKWEQMLGLPLVLGNAKDTFANADPALYDKVLYTPGYVPPAGAIAAWDGVWGEGNGHTAVVEDATPSLMRVFEQNDGDGGLPHVGVHNYQDVIGFFIPKVLNQAGGEMVDDTITKRAYLAAEDKDLDSEPGGQGVYDYWRGRPVVELLDALYKDNEDFRYRANNYLRVLAALDDLKTSVAAGAAAPAQPTPPVRPGPTVETGPPQPSSPAAGSPAAPPGSLGAAPVVTDPVSESLQNTSSSPSVNNDNNNPLGEDPVSTLEEEIRQIARDEVAKLSTPAVQSTLAAVETKIGQFIVGIGGTAAISAGTAISGAGASTTGKVAAVGVGVNLAHLVLNALVGAFTKK